jgi:peptidoglycan-associated lipoprotein
MIRTFRLTFLLAAIVVAAGCSTTNLDEPAPIDDKGTASSSTAPTSGSAQASAVGTAPVDPRAVAPVAAGSRDPLNDPAGPLAKRSVYFDFDSFVVNPQFQPLVEAHARYLNSNKGRRVTIEGNADERGSREYNLALGQKRADAVKSRMGLLGVSDQQIETVSFGEEKPRSTGHDEAAWAENRRADIVYK